MTIASVMIRDLSPKGTTWSLRVRCVRIYDVPSFSGRKDDIWSTEVVFRDGNNDTVQASIKKAHIRELKKKLAEGRLYNISNFMVSINGAKFKTSLFKYKISFFMKTKVTEIFDDAFPQNRFLFSTFDEILTMKRDTQVLLLDVVGRYAGSDPPVETTNGKRFKEFFLEDTDGRRLTLTLWDEWVDKVTSDLDKESEIAGDIIIVVQFCRVKDFGDVNHVTNTYNVTNIIINGGDPQVLELRSRFAKLDTAILPTGSASEPGLSSISNEFASKRAEVKNISHVMEMERSGAYWIFCIIVEVEDWQKCWYMSCNKCPRKLSEENEKYICSKCGIQDGGECYRYMLHLRVIDDSGNGLLVCWDKEANQLIGLSAAELKQKIDVSSDEIPAELTALCDKRIVVKVQVREKRTSSFEKTFSVIKLTENEEILEMVESLAVGSQESDFLSETKPVESVADKEMVEVSDGEVSTPDKTNGKKKVHDGPGLECESDAKRKLDSCLSTNLGKQRKVVVKKEKD